MSSENKIVFVSSIFRDLVAVSQKFPKPGETIPGSDFFMGFGGKGANQCVMAAKLGAETIIVGKVGDDEHGNAYIKNLKDVNVNISHLSTVPGISTGIATIFVESSSGENMIVIVPGANTKVTEDDVIKAEDDIAKSTAVVATLELGMSAVREAMKLGRKHGIKTILNAAPARADYGRDILENVDILVVNETEAELLSGDADPDKAGEVLKNICKNVIITLGKDGALLWEEGKGRAKIDIVKMKQEEVVDTTGAGDAFVGSLAYFLASRSDLSLTEAVQRSCHVASITVKRSGTQASYPSRSEVAEIL